MKNKVFGKERERERKNRRKRLRERKRAPKELVRQMISIQMMRLRRQQHQTNPMNQVEQMDLTMKMIITTLIAEAQADIVLRRAPTKR